jgi:hypothetical protein
MPPAGPRFRTPTLDTMLTYSEAKMRTGDAVKRLAQQHATRLNNSELLTTLRHRRLPRDRYVAFVAAMYPCVVGFNRGLLKGIAKVDHVRQSAFVKALAEQIMEEQAHNGLWRKKLAHYGVDHEAVYDAYERYVAQFSARDLDRMTRDVLAALTADYSNYAPRVFPSPPLPEPVLALCHHLSMTATYDSYSHWEHFATQAGMEMVIFDIVSTSIWPGVSGNPELDEGPATMQWWNEHARQGSVASGGRSDEEKHLELSMIALSRAQLSPSQKEQVVNRAEDAMRLFAASIMCHDFGAASFSAERYAAKKSA